MGFCKFDLFYYYETTNEWKLISLLEEKISNSHLCHGTWLPGSCITVHDLWQLSERSYYLVIYLPADVNNQLVLNSRVYVHQYYVGLLPEICVLESTSLLCTITTGNSCRISSSESFIATWRQKHLWAFNEGKAIFYLPRAIIRNASFNARHELIWPDSFIVRHSNLPKCFYSILQYQSSLIRVLVSWFRFSGLLFILLLVTEYCTHIRTSRRTLLYHRYVLVFRSNKVLRLTGTIVTGTLLIS
jgi:hypothetical protein